MEGAAVMSPQLAGLPPLGEKFAWSAGAEYFITYYAFTGQKGNGKDAIFQNHLFSYYVDKAIAEAAGERPQRKPRQKNEKGIFVFAAAAILIVAVIAAVIPKEVNKPAENKAAESPEIKNYVASIKGEQYHYLSCRYADQIAKENAVYFFYYGDAIEAGYKPYSVCHPPKG